MATGDEFDRLIGIMHRLRKECPWDRSQDHDTLRSYLLEEAYEVLHALDERQYDALRDELGDLMLQIVFHAEIAEEAGRFAIEDVLRGINEKLVRRHPHVFGDKEAETPADVVRRWERIKTGEEKRASSLDGVPAALPALVRAARVLSKIRQTGVDPFEGADLAAAGRLWLERLAEAMASPDGARADGAAGMLAMVIAEMAARAGANAEDALRNAVTRLSDEFQRHEARLREEGRSLTALPREELDRIAAQLRAACEET